MNDADVTIKINFLVEKIRDVSAQFDAQIDKVKGKMLDLKAAMTQVKFDKSLSKGNRNGMLEIMRKQSEGLQVELGRIRQMKKQAVEPLKKNLFTERIAQSSKRAADKMKLFNGQFQGWALSIMFFGMAVQRIFNNIWKSALKTFQDVAHSVEGNVTQFDMLQGAVKYLQFLAGEALAPFLEWLTPIVFAMAEWIDQNPRLFRWIVLIGTAVGALATFIGFATLALNGFIQVFSMLGAGTLVKGILAAFKGLIPAISGSVLLVIGIIAALIAVLVAMWMTNFGNIREFVIETFGAVWTAIRGVVDGIIQVFGGVWKVVKGFFLADFDLLWEGLLDIIEGSMKIVANLLFGIAAIIANAFIFAMNVSKDIVLSTISLMIQAAVRLIRILNRIPGVNISTDGLNKAVDYLRGLSDSTDIPYFTSEVVSNAVGNFVPQRAQTSTTVVNVNVEGRSQETDNQLINNLSDKILTTLKQNQ